MAASLALTKINREVGGTEILNQVVSFNLGRIFLFFIFGFKLL
jgi:hypothetical protein